MLRLLVLLLALGTPCPAEVAQRPQLQIFNASGQPAEIFWLKDGTERRFNGALKPGENTVITTSIGHRFALVAKESKAEETVTAELWVQAFVFQPEAAAVTQRTVPGGQLMSPPQGLKIPAFYTQFISADGFPVVASSKVNPYALKEAAYLIHLMLGDHPQVLQAMIRSGARMSVLAHNEFTTDLPEFAHFIHEPHKDFPGISGKDYWDRRARGTGGSQTDPFCTSAEENLLGFPGDPYEKECILIHELAHCIHLRGMVNIDPTFDRRVKESWEKAMKAGLWKGKYPSVNHHEYFAEGTQSWFDNNRVNDHDHNHVNTRALLKEYDPGLAALCREVYGDTVIKYTKPAARLAGHMTGYDPATVPTFAWPERLAGVNEAIIARARKRDHEANLRETRTLSGWTVHIHKELLTPENEPATTHALELLKSMLDEIIRKVPRPAVARLQEVPLWFSPEYSGIQPRAEYHPDAGWLRDNGRDPIMAKGVEFTSVRNFEAEMRRMPNFALHELAHSYHDRVIADGFDNADIKAAYEKARASGKYDRVERHHGDDRKTFERAYAMTNPQEYFAESTEAFFSNNDFFPFNREELKQHDPEMYALLVRLWGASR